MASNAVRTAMLALAVLCALPARADYDAGQRAWDAGRPDEALVQWTAAAEAGDRWAMLALGKLYAQGLGALQDYVEAHKWFNLAASRGEAEAVKERDALAAKMTPQQVQAAQELARSWRPGGGGSAAAAETAGAAGSTGATAAAPAPAPDTGRPSPWTIREAQALLAGLGYAPGPADGVWGRRTGQAYRAFLRDAGLPGAERLTPEALRTMRAMAKRAGVVAGASAQPSASVAPAPAAHRPDALHWAAHAGDVAGLQAALAGGADVDARDGRSWTALMHAVDKGYPLLVELLLAAGADVDVRAPDGATALFMAAVHGHTGIIELLMAAGADLSVRGPQGKTAVDVARARYGDANAAREANEPPAVLALLQGMTSADAADAADDAAFARAKAQDTAEAYGAYRSSYPEGRHAEAAERRERERSVGGKFRDCPQCPEMVVVPGGQFGSPFAVGVYEVTFGEWDACVAGGGCGGYRPDDEGWGRGNRPVINVNWDDAKAYVRWLSRKTGKEYRLLSEAEWEYVARAGTSTKYWWGNDIGRNRANCDGCGSRWDNRQTAPVGSFTANPFGLYDVHGNVFEWVEDCGEGDCSRRVLRGGSWDGTSRYGLSGDRGRYTTGIRDSYVGFRIARTLTP